jgi:hypothetical protein
MACKAKAHRTARADLTAVSEAAAPELRRLWEARRGSPPPLTLSARLMRAALAWDIQAEELGGESPAIGRQWRAVMRPREEGARADAVVGGLAPPAATTGTRLLKSWGGVMQEVIVQDGGILWNGKVYTSLSAVARAMTGTPRNGPRFFGLREDKR